MSADFVLHENIRRCERLLLIETDPVKRALILDVLGEERAKEVASRQRPKPPAA